MKNQTELNKKKRICSKSIIILMNFQKIVKNFQSQKYHRQRIV